MICKLLYEWTRYWMFKIFLNVVNMVSYIHTFSVWWLSYKDSMKPVIADKHPCNQIYIKTNIYIFTIILYNNSTTDIEHSPKLYGIWSATNLPSDIEKMIHCCNIYNIIIYNIYIVYYLYIYAGHRWRSREELIRDVLLWTPTHGRAKAGRPARTYIQQLCEDTGCCQEDLPRAMNDREEWRERVRDIRALPVRYDDGDDDIYIYILGSSSFQLDVFHSYFKP